MTGIGSVRTEVKSMVRFSALFLILLLGGCVYVHHLDNDVPIDLELKGDHHERSD